MPGLDARAIRRLIRGGQQPPASPGGAAARHARPPCPPSPPRLPARPGDLPDGRRGQRRQPRACARATSGSARSPAWPARSARGRWSPGCGPPSAPPASPRPSRTRPGGCGWSRSRAGRRWTAPRSRSPAPSSTCSAAWCAARAGPCRGTGCGRRCGARTAARTGGRTVDVYIAQLRAKLGPGHGIRTVRGIGYVMDREPPHRSRGRPAAPGPRSDPGADRPPEASRYDRGRRASDPRGQRNRVSVLDEILEGVRADLEQRQREVALDRLKEMARQAPSCRDALAALGGDDVAVIAEVKRGSPSRGAMAAIDDPAALATDYEAGGARVISVLTEASAGSAAAWPTSPRSAARCRYRCCARTSSSAPTSSGRRGRTAPTSSC